MNIANTDKPQTVHDFGGFPRALCSFQYPAPRSPELAVRIQQQLQSQGSSARPDVRRGLDHGAWVLLTHLFPKLDVPVVQVSLPVDVHEAKRWSPRRPRSSRSRRLSSRWPDALPDPCGKSPPK